MSSCHLVVGREHVAAARVLARARGRADDRGLGEHTVLVRYRSDARLSLELASGAGAAGVKRLTAGEVSRFLAGECPRRRFSAVIRRLLASCDGRRTVGWRDYDPFVAD
jgi:hypothetical protein